MNVVTLIGNLATDVELKEVGERQEAGHVPARRRPRGATRARTSSASRRGTARPRCAPSTSRKGARIAVDGRLRSRSWEDPDGNRRSAVEVVANRVQFLDRAGREGGDALRGGSGDIRSSGLGPTRRHPRVRRRRCSRSSGFRSTAAPGLQVLGADEVTKIACGVSSSRELFERAAAAGAQLVLVHHGLFWRNEPLVVDRRLRGTAAKRCSRPT